MTRFGPLAVFLLAAALLPAQGKVSITPRSRAVRSTISRNTVNLRYDVRLVQIPVVVTDARGTPIVDLSKEAFRLFEDDHPRVISAFSVADSPISVTLIFDTSRSMKSRIGNARAGVEQFLGASMPGDEFSLIRFSDTAQVALGFTSQPADVSRRLSFVQPRGWTALFDAVLLGAQQARQGKNQRKVLVVFSDGDDNYSRYSESELVSRLRELDIEVYALSIFEKPRALERISEETGGRAFWVRRLDDLPAAIGRLNQQMRSEYLIGYDPGPMANDGKYHRVRVEVQPPPGMSRVRTSWRHGYTAPGE